MCSFYQLRAERGHMWLQLFDVHHAGYLISAFEWIWRLCEGTDLGRCIREWGPEKERLCWDAVRAAPAVEIRKERRGQAGAASENSRKDNKEGVSCECPLRKSPPPSTLISLLRTGCWLVSHIEPIYHSLANQIKLSMGVGVRRGF